MAISFQKPQQNAWRYNMKKAADLSGLVVVLGPKKKPPNFGGFGGYVGATIR